MEKFDVCVIGAGPAGYKAALLLSKGGKKVCLVEKSDTHIGGTCLNEGCIPAKNYIEISHYKDRSTHFFSNGLKGELKEIDIKSLKNSTSKLLDSLREGLKNKLKSKKVELFFGLAEFVSDKEILLKESNTFINADRFIIATGSRHKEHPVLKIDKELILSSDEVFLLEELPKRLLIVGAGAIGCEFATFFNACGVDVHLMEFTSSILPSEDKDVSDTLQREFKKRGIKIDVSTEVKSYKIAKNTVEITYIDKSGNEHTKVYDKVLVSIGRSPNTKDLKLENIDLKTTEGGFIEVNLDQQTSLPNIYAIGDITTSAMLAHVAYQEAKNVSKAILKGKNIKEKEIPNVIFTTPQVGSVGKKEKELQEDGVKYVVKKLFMKSLGMPKIKGDDSGFVKLILDVNEQSMLGCSIVGYNATEVINQVAIALNKNMTVEEFDETIIAHPTMSESFLKLVETI